MKRWTQIFKALANINRLKIINLLANGMSLTVTQITDELDISFRGTSRHLLLLHGLDILSSVGRNGHVFYSYNRSLPGDVKKIVEIFLKDV